MVTSVNPLEPSLLAKKILLEFLPSICSYDPTRNPTPFSLNQTSTLQSTGVDARSEAGPACILPKVSPQPQRQDPLLLETPSVLLFALVLGSTHLTDRSLLQSAVQGNANQDGSEALESIYKGTWSRDLLSPQRCHDHTFCSIGALSAWRAWGVSSEQHILSPVQSSSS